MPGKSHLLLRNTRTGAFQIYNINHGRLTGSVSLGPVGLDWKFAGVAPVSAAGASDLVLRNDNTGAFQVYNIANNQITVCPVYRPPQGSTGTFRGEMPRRSGA
jgi:hypothetical protein